MLILFYTIQQVIPNICTKFKKILDAVVPEKSLTQISLCITLEWEIKKKEKWKKKAKINHSILVFFPKIYSALLKVYKNFEDWLSQASRFLWWKFLLEREKWKN